MHSYPTDLTKHKSSCLHFSFNLGFERETAWKGCFWYSHLEVPESLAGCWRMFGTWDILLIWPNLGTARGLPYITNFWGASHSGTCWISREHLYTHNWYFQLNKIHIQQIPTLCIISNAASEWGCIFITSLPISYFPFLTFTVTSYMPSCLMLSYLEPFGNMIHHFSNFSRLPLLVSRLQRELFSLILLNCPPLLTPSVISKIWRFKEKTKMKKKQCNWKAA